MFNSGVRAEQQRTKAALLAAKREVEQKSRILKSNRCGYEIAGYGLCTLFKENGKKRCRDHTKYEKRNRKNQKEAAHKKARTTNEERQICELDHNLHRSSLGARTEPRSLLPSAQFYSGPLYYPDPAPVAPPPPTAPQPPRSMFANIGALFGSQS